MAAYGIDNPKVVAAVTTPIGEQGTVHSRLVDIVMYNMSRSGTRNVFINGDTGDFRYNPTQLRRQMTLFGSEYGSKYGLRIFDNITPAKDESPGEIKKYIDYALRCNVYGMVLMLKYVQGLQEGKSEVSYLANAAIECRRPLLVYEHSGACDGRVSDEKQIRDIVTLPFVIGAKTSAGFDQCIKWIENTPDEFLVLIGDQRNYGRVLEYCMCNQVDPRKIGFVSGWSSFMPEWFINYLDDLRLTNLF